MSTRTHRIHCIPVPSTSCPFTPPLCNKICCTGISSWTKLPLWPGNIKPIPHVYNTMSGPPASTRQTPLKIQAICTHRKQTSGAFPNKSPCCKGSAQAFLHKTLPQSHVFKVSSCGLRNFICSCGFYCNFASYRSHFKASLGLIPGTVTTLDFSLVLWYPSGDFLRQSCDHQATLKTTALLVTRLCCL